MSIFLYLQIKAEGEAKECLGCSKAQADIPMLSREAVPLWQVSVCVSGGGICLRMSEGNPRTSWPLRAQAMGTAAGGTAVVSQRMLSKGHTEKRMGNM